MKTSAIERMQLRIAELTIERARIEVSAARVALEQQEIAREYLFECAARELGRETAMRILQRIRLVEPPEVPEVPSVAPPLGFPGEPSR